MPRPGNSNNRENNRYRIQQQIDYDSSTNDGVTFLLGFFVVLFIYGVLTSGAGRSGGTNNNDINNNSGENLESLIKDVEINENNELILPKKFYNALEDENISKELLDALKKK